MTEVAVFIAGILAFAGIAAMVFDAIDHAIDRRELKKFLREREAYLKEEGNE